MLPLVDYTRTAGPRIYTVDEEQQAGKTDCQGGGAETMGVKNRCGRCGRCVLLQLWEIKCTASC